ncbi:MAG: DUF2271 domain-containing protein [Asticcacaulis sp.]
MSGQHTGWVSPTLVKSSCVLGTLAGSLVLAGPAMAADLVLTVDIPKLNVAEYHKPYVSVWIETPAGAPVATLAVWYDVKLRNEEGKTWLKDMRQWWRKIGRGMTLPADGISGATKAPGRHTVSFAGTSPALARLPAGDYVLRVEAAREVGGREALDLAFTWDPKKAPSKSGGLQTVTAKGQSELGLVSLSVKP